MTKAMKRGIIVLAAFIIGCAAFAGSVIFAYVQSATGSNNSSDVYTEAEDTLRGYLVYGDIRSGYGSTEETVNKRLSQRVTVTDGEGTLPISGTVVKAKDGFYPGTYNLSFSENRILTEKVTVDVKMDINPGENVYVLVGDMDDGYIQYATAVVDDNKVVSFKTDVIQDYTLSTTDIRSAQRAMADLFSDAY